MLLYCAIKAFNMSRELLEFSDLIDEQFELPDTETEPDDFWESVLNLFI